MSSIPADIATMCARHFLNSSDASNTNDSTGPTVGSLLFFGLTDIGGAQMVGICLNWGFMGILVVQLCASPEPTQSSLRDFFSLARLLSRKLPDDPLFVKFLVYGLALLDILQTAMVTADAFHWFVYGFGNMDQLDQTFLNSWDVPVLDAIISLVVQAFYCWRIYFLRKNIILPIIILLVSLTQCVAGIWTGIRVRAASSLLGYFSVASAALIVPQIWLVGGAVADVAIAGVLSWTLLHQRSNTIRSGTTHTIISRVINSVAVIALILFWGVPKHSTLVVPPTAIMGKLYTNCLIALFNNRHKDVKSNEHGMNSIHLPDSLSSHSNTGPVKVHVVREMDLVYDGQMQVELGHLDLQKPNQTLA
ncbi:hypothetical protein B0H13DRAFT_2007401 [Mycena leptocephala]|nr:hypothetical protein B0H13DRAFT_2007401 [Mycena leptocephala]